MQQFLDNVSEEKNRQLHQGAHTKAIIGPHAGFSYSAQTAAFAYKFLDTEKYNKIVFMGPSHRKYIRGVALCASHEIETPLGNLRVDRESVDEMANRMDVKFQKLDLNEEEQEHCLEMHFPWVAKMFEKRLDKISVIPLIVGDLSSQSAKEYASVLLPLLESDDVLFVVSSDFCHWGDRFDYTHYEKKYGAIYQSIEAVDRMGMEKISTLDPDEFRAYLKTYHNTICGRNPILLLMQMMTLVSDGKFKMEWLHYAQSSQVIDAGDSSVSYASGVLQMQG